MIEIKHRYTYTGKVLHTVYADSLVGANLTGTYLAGANLEGANLVGANLRGVNLYGASLADANLVRASLADANLAGANLEGTYLAGTNLYGANLVRASLADANLAGANLADANLEGADLAGTNLRGANLPHFQIVPSEGSFIAWKKTSGGVIRVCIPADAQRTSSLIGRKCRASKMIPIDSGGISPTHVEKSIAYNIVGVEIDDSANYDPDIRIECTGGLHFYMTEAEAQAH